MGPSRVEDITKFSSMPPTQITFCSFSHLATADAAMMQRRLSPSYKASAGSGSYVGLNCTQSAASGIGHAGPSIKQSV